MTHPSPEAVEPRPRVLAEVETALRMALKVARDSFPTDERDNIDITPGGSMQAAWDLYILAEKQAAAALATAQQKLDEQAAELDGLRKLAAEQAALAARPHIEREVMAAELAALKAELSMPRNQCSECGSTGPFKGIVYPSSPNGPEEYDIQCEECGSLRIEESPRSAFHDAERRWEKRLEEAEKRAESAEARVVELTRLAKRTVDLLTDYQNIETPDQGIYLKKCIEGFKPELEAALASTDSDVLKKGGGK